MERENVFYIKNMVCNRCILVVTRLLEKAGFTPLDVGLGTVVVQEKPAGSSGRRSANCSKPTGSN